MKKWMPAFFAAQHVVLWSLTSLLLDLSVMTWLAGVSVGLVSGLTAYGLYRANLRPLRQHRH